MPNSSAMTSCLSKCAAEPNTSAGVCGVTGDKGDQGSELASDDMGDGHENGEYTEQKESIRVDLICVKANRPSDDVWGSREGIF